MIRPGGRELLPLSETRPDGDGLEARLLAGGNVERGVADDIDVIGTKRLAGQLLGAESGFLQEGRTVEGIGTVSAEKEIHVETGGLELDARAFFHVAGAQTEQNALISTEMFEKSLQTRGDVIPRFEWKPGRNGKMFEIFLVEVSIAYASAFARRAR